MEQLSPLTRTVSPFKDPRPPPSTPAKTARLWDEYERRAVENAKQRDKNKGFKVRNPHRVSMGNIRKSSESSRTHAHKKSSIDFKTEGSHVVLPSTTVAICKTCKQPITYASGICERCKKTIVLSKTNEDNTTTTTILRPNVPLKHYAAPAPRTLHDPVTEMSIPKATSPRRRSFCPLPLQLVDPPMRMPSLQPPPMPGSVCDPSRGRKASLTDPHEPFLRIQIAQEHINHPSTRSVSHPTTPTTMTMAGMPLTPPSTSHSRSSTRTSSLANIAQLPLSTSRSNSATPNDFHNLHPFATASTTPTSPPSLCRSSYALQNTTSAWDDWDSDDEEEKAGLVGVSGWMGRRKGKKGKSSMDSTDSSGSGGAVKAERKSRDNKDKKSREEDPLEQVRLETAEKVRAKRASGEERRGSKPNGFVRVISCGCRED